jgi:hypothetical protein
MQRRCPLWRLRWTRSSRRCRGRAPRTSAPLLHRRRAAAATHCARCWLCSARLLPFVLRVTCRAPINQIVEVVARILTWTTVELEARGIRRDNDVAFDVKVTVALLPHTNTHTHTYTLSECYTHCCAHPCTRKRARTRMHPVRHTPKRHPIHTFAHAHSSVRAGTHAVPAQRKACGVLRALLEGQSGSHGVEMRMAAALNFSVMRSTMCMCYRNAAAEYEVQLPQVQCICLCVLVRARGVQRYVFC